MSITNPYNVFGHIKSEVARFNYTRRYAQEQAHKKMWWDEICRQICPDIFKIHKDHLQIDDFRVECLIIGKNQGTTEGLPTATAYDFQKQLMNTTLKGCIIQITEKLVPIPTAEAQGLLNEAIYYNHGNQLNYVKNNDLGVADENLRLDYEDMKAQVRILHENKENMFHAAYIITIWAEDETAMKIAKSHIKGVLRENMILGELPLKKMYEAFMTGQPYPNMEDFATIETYSGLAAIISPTINPFSPLAGTGKGIYIGNETNTGKDVTLDFFSEAAPHAVIVGATGSGKTFLLVLLMIRLYIEGRKVTYLTMKKDDHTKYRAIAEYFAPNGGIVEIGPGRHNINPLQIIYDKSMENISVEQARSIYDNHKEIFAAFMKTYCGAEYSVNQDSYIDQSLNELYKSKGIFRDDPKTWSDPSKFPTMNDLVEKWDNDYPHLLGHRKGTCEVLINKNYKFRIGGAYDYVNSPTDADFWLQFSVIDIVNVPSGLREPMNVFVTGVLASQVAATSTKGFSIIIDEGGAFLRDAKLADMIMTGLTQWRSQNTQLIFATQQFGDLERAKMSEAFMSNTFFKIVFGANMDESVIPYVQKFLHLNDQHVESLKTLKLGQCLVKIRNKYVNVDVTSSDKEYELIKGIQPHIDEREVIEMTQDKQYRVKEMYQPISNVHKIIFENWLEGEYSEAALRKDGFQFFNPQRISGSGTTKSWIHNSIIRGNKVEQQTPDHYNTVIQIAAHLIENGFENVRINHWNDVDVVGELNGQTYAFEFERDGTHSIDYIFEKFSNARVSYDHVYIVCVASNKSKVIKAVEPDGAVPYGEKPKNMCTRGTQFADLIKDIIAGNKPMNAPILNAKRYTGEKTDTSDDESQLYIPEEEVYSKEHDEDGPMTDDSKKKSVLDEIGNTLNIFRKKTDQAKTDPKNGKKTEYYFKPLKKDENGDEQRRASIEECDNNTEILKDVLTTAYVPDIEPPEGTGVEKSEDGNRVRHGDDDSPYKGFTLKPLAAELFSMTLTPEATELFTRYATDFEGGNEDEGVKSSPEEKPEEEVKEETEEKQSDENVPEPEETKENPVININPGIDVQVSSLNTDIDIPTDNKSPKVSDDLLIEDQSEVEPTKETGQKSGNESWWEL